MPRPRGLALALLTAAAITGLYAGYSEAIGAPPAASLLGHALGIVGFVMMLMTETLYSLRKRAMRRPRGSMRSWLQFHVFTGIVGSWLVVLHSAGSFRGLAGALTVMTLVVVASGFVGRYIYTAVPRTADGAEIEAQELQRMLEDARQAVVQASLASSAALAGAGAGAGAVAGAAVSRSTRRRDAAATRRLHQLERQVSALRWARRMLATWHAVHVPLGMALFVLAFAHIGAAVYYATLLR